MVHAIPAPQWLTTETLANLRQAADPAPTDELWAIVRALAESNPEDGETGDCIMCGAVGKPVGVTLSVPDDDHDEDCAYMRARRVVADPAPTDQPREEGT